MDRSIHNPWTWQDRFGFVQANAVSDATRTVYCAGQTSVDGDGNPLHGGDIGEQIKVAVDNLETVLASAGLTLADVVRLTTYVTDMEAFFSSYDVLAERLGSAGCRYAGTLVEVKRLAIPSLMIELEATAVG